MAYWCESCQVPVLGKICHNCGAKLNMSFPDKGVPVFKEETKLLSKLTGEALDFDDFDLIIAMDLENYNDLMHLAKSDENKNKIRLLREFDPYGSNNAGVPDPYYGGIHGFEETYQIVERSVSGLLDALDAGELLF